MEQRDPLDQRAFRSSHYWCWLDLLRTKRITCLVCWPWLGKTRHRPSHKYGPFLCLPAAFASVPFLPSPSDHPPTNFASVPSLPSTSYKICGRSVPLITLQKSLRALSSSHHPPKKNCERSVPPITLLKKLRAFRSSHFPFKKGGSAPFLPSPS